MTVESAGRRGEEPLIRMSEFLMPAEKENIRLEHFEITADDLYALSCGDVPGAYVRLRIDVEIMMTDTKMEWDTNKSFIRKSRGDILIGGLGLGMIVMAIQNKRTVTSITIVEKSQTVIDLVASQLPLNHKVKVLQGDVFAYEPDSKFDMIYLDIWSEIDQEVFLKQMIPLKAKYSRYLKSNTGSNRGEVLCWAEKNARSGRPLATQDFSSIKLPVQGNQ